MVLYHKVKLLLYIGISTPRCTEMGLKKRSSIYTSHDEPSRIQLYHKNSSSHSAVVQNRELEKRRHEGE